MQLPLFVFVTQEGKGAVGLFFKENTCWNTFLEKGVFKFESL